MLQFWCRPTTDDISIEQDSASVSPGFPYHRSIEALTISADTCPLCALVQVGVQTWIDGWNDAARNNKALFIEFELETNAIPLSFTEQLWLTQCHNEAKGFYVWIGQPRELRLNFLTAVGFSVNSGQYLGT